MYTRYTYKHSVQVDLLLFKLFDRYLQVKENGKLNVKNGLKWVKWKKERMKDELKNSQWVVGGSFFLSLFYYRCLFTIQNHSDVKKILKWIRTKK